MTQIIVEEENKEKSVTIYSLLRSDVIFFLSKLLYGMRRQISIEPSG